MKLLNLNPQWMTPVPGIEPAVHHGAAVRVLVFDCPCGMGHRLRIPVSATGMPEGRDIATGTYVWRRDGEWSDDFAALSLHPSVNAHCWHGWIKNGEVTP